MGKRRWPERPAYRPEQRRVGYWLLFAFALLFACRLCRDKLNLFGDALWLATFFELFACGAPLLFFIATRRGNRRRMLRLRTPLPATLPLLICGFFALLTGTVLLSLLTGGFGTLGSVSAAFSAGQEGGFALRSAAFLALCLLPAFLEELLFRGVAIAEYERRGMVRAVVMSSLLFALLHFDLRNLPAYLFFGALTAALLYATESLPAVMVTHALVAGTIFFTHKYVAALYAYTGNAPLLFFLLTLACLGALLAFCRLCMGIYRARDEMRLDDPRRAVPMNVQLFTLLDAVTDPAVVLCFGLSIAGFVLFR